MGQCHLGSGNKVYQENRVWPYHNSESMNVDCHHGTVGLITILTYWHDTDRKVNMKSLKKGEAF